MMAVAADTHIQLGISKPKKDATVGTGALTLGASELAIKIGSALQVTRPLIYIGDFEKLYRYAKADIKNVTADTTYSITPGGADNDIVKTGHTTGTVSLYIDSAVLTGDKSHFLHRTYKRLIERLLEEAK